MFIELASLNLLASAARWRDNPWSPRPQKKVQAMNPPKRFKDMRNEDLPAELIELGELLETIDSDRSEQLLSS